MEDMLEMIRREMYRDAHPQCPHCGEEIDFTDPEFAANFTSYWGDTGPHEDECPHCQKPILINEVVRRSWDIEIPPEHRP